MSKTILVTSASSGIGEAAVEALVSRVIQPGAILTEGTGICRDGLMKNSGEGAYREGARALDRTMAAANEGSMPSPPSVVAGTILTAIQARRPRTRYATGGGAKLLLFLRRLLSDRAFDAMMRKFVRQETSAS